MSRKSMIDFVEREADGVCVYDGDFIWSVLDTNGMLYDYLKQDTKTERSLYFRRELIATYFKFIYCSYIGNRAFQLISRQRKLWRRRQREVLIEMTKGERLFKEGGKDGE